MEKESVNAGEAIREALSKFQKSHVGIRTLCVHILRKTAFGMSIMMVAKVDIEKFTEDVWDNRDGIDILLPKGWKEYRFTKERPVRMEDIRMITYRSQVVYQVD